ncbi:hypothetical protein CIPAW_07G191000 [Carya illinoinensis]|uniref:Uncharacterized protein n=1 Tax=Carya illinoinensis TaxID=32201 RepID=A0A8T1Q120_CARIL|nr:hypothetical protein CIPAW_07G191000 [Carya illinoinensis]
METRKVVPIIAAAASRMMILLPLSKSLLEMMPPKAVITIGFDRS